MRHQLCRYICREYIPARANFLGLAVAFVSVLFLASAGELCASEGKGPQAGIKPLDGKGRMQISTGDRCPVCGMNVIRYPKFAGAIQLNNGTTFYFCSTGCMIRSWMHPEIYLGTAPINLKLPVVKEYFSGRDVDGRNVFFVFGSDVIGPMGPAMVPILDRADLNVFKKRHGGKTPFLLNDLNDDKWFEITGRRIGK